MRVTSVDSCTLECSGYLSCTASTHENAPYFTDIICSALVSVEGLDSVEDAPLRSAPEGEINILACFWFRLIEPSFV